MNPRKRLLATLLTTRPPWWLSARLHGFAAFVVILAVMVDDGTGSHGANMMLRSWRVADGSFVTYGDSPAPAQGREVWNVRVAIGKDRTPFAHAILVLPFVQRNDVFGQALPPPTQGDIAAFLSSVAETHFTQGVASAWGARESDRLRRLIALGGGRMEYRTPVDAVKLGLAICGVGWAFASCIVGFLRHGQTVFYRSALRNCRRGLCAECGYSLSGLARATCPECGCNVDGCLAEASEALRPTDIVWKESECIQLKQNGVARV